MFGRVNGPTWGSKPVAIVAGGPSLRGFDFERLRGRFHVLALKASMFDLPWADAAFGLDSISLTQWRSKLMKMNMANYWAVPDYWFRTCPEAKRLPITFLQRRTGLVLSDDPGFITSGGSSGFAGLNFAVLKKAKEVRLLGYDYQPTGHHNDQYYPGRIEDTELKWHQWAQNFDAIAPALLDLGVRVVNASPDSTINAFEKCSLEEAVA